MLEPVLTLSMQYSLSLLHSLINRWRESAHRSVWWQAHPTELNCIDLCRLDIQEEEAASRWVQKLISGQRLEAEISPDAYSGPVVRHLYVENRNGERRRGKRPLGIGYPVIMRENPDNPFHPFTIPVFIWKANLEHHQVQTDSYLLKREEASSVFINPYLLYDLEPRREVLTTLWETHRKLQQGDWKTRDLIAAIEEIAKVNSLDYEFVDKGIQRFPTTQQAAILGQRGSVVWSGVLTTFPDSTLSIRRRLGEELDRLEELGDQQQTGQQEVLDSQSEAAGGHPFGLFLPTQGQETALRASQNHHLSMVFGPSGSGKSVALANILTNALSNGARCLVISSEISSLQHTQTRLLESGIEGQSFLLKEERNDQPLLFELFRRAGERVKTNSPFPEEQFELLLQKAWRLHARLQKEFEAVNSPIFGHLNWTETVGVFLKSNRQEGKELLGSQLSPNDFVFTFSEYQMLKEAIEYSQPLYVPINSLRHPLSELNDYIYLSLTVDEARQYLELHLEETLTQATSLQYRYIAKLDSYAEKLTTHYEEFYRELREHLRQLNENIEDYKNKYGSDFEDSGVVNTSKLHVYGVFSNKHKNILQAKDAIARDYSILQKLHLQHGYFDYRFSDIGVEHRNIKKITQNLEDFEKTLNHWYRRIPQSVQEDLQRLTSKNIHSGLDFGEQLEELEYSLDVLIEQVNDLKIFRDPLNNNTLTLHKRKKVLEDIIENLEQARFQMRDFEQFHPWQSNWLKLGELSRKLIRALTKVKPDNWMAAFESWYFHNQLTLGFQTDTPQQETPLKVCHEAIENLRSILPAQIRHVWHKKLTSSLRIMRRVNRQLYQSTFGRHSAEQSGTISLKMLFEEATDAVLDAVPALLATPEQAAAILPGKRTQPLFDLILIDQAQTLSVETALPLLWLGHRTVLFGNPESAIDERSQSILNLAAQTGSKQIPLTEIVYPFPENLKTTLQDLLHPYPTVAFPLGRQAWPPIATTTFTDGLYDENACTNFKEAEAIVEMLKELQPSTNLTFPRIVIACATPQQRDCISDLLVKTKQQGGDPDEKIRQLERNGLLVVSFDEMSGLKADVRMLSMTFGPSDHSGVLNEDIQTLNIPERASATKLALTQNCRQFYLFHSLPPKSIDDLAKASSDATTSIICQLIRRLEDPDANDAPRKTGDHHAGIGQGNSESIFCEEVARALQPYLGHGRLQLNQLIDDIHIPLVVNPISEGRDRIAILPDGFLNRAEPVALQWENYLRTLLEAKNFRFLTTWSANWWRDPKQEARKLASLIIRLDNQPDKDTKPPEIEPDGE